jgi:hypothetical protein
VGQEVVDGLRVVGGALQVQAREVSEVSARAAQQVGELIAALKAESGGMGTAATAAEDRVESMGRILRQHAADLAKASVGAADEIARAGDTLKSFTAEVHTALDAAGRQAREIGDTFEEQAATLVEAANQAEAQARVIRQNAFDSRRDMFLRASKFVIEDLNSAAIDLFRLMDGAKAQKLWPKFAKGDRGIFVRGLVSDDGEKGARDVIRGKYEGDENFRKYVTRYIEHFEKLLNEANESDPENLLSSTFLSADVGKLYLLLARSVGRLN